MKTTTKVINMEQGDIDFMNEWKDKFIQDKNSGHHFYAAKETLQRVRDILQSYFLDERVKLFPVIVNCSGCDETVEMVHYAYKKFADYNRKGGEYEQG